MVGWSISRSGRGMTQYCRNFLIICFVVSLSIGCTTLDGSYQKDSKLLIEYALYDFPFPTTAKIIEEETVILGSGERWSGKVRFLDPKSPAQLLKFYSEVVPGSGWTIKASTVSAGIFLVFSKDGRVATVEINRLSFFKGRPLFSTGKTSVVVSVNHAGHASVPQLQNQQK